MDDYWSQTNSGNKENIYFVENYNLYNYRLVIFSFSSKNLKFVIIS